MSHQHRSSTERFATILFIITVASLVWIVQSHAYKSSESRTEDSFSTQQPSKRKERKCPNCAPPGNQEIYIPLIDLPEARGSEIVFNSRSPQTMNVTPVFYKRNGEVVIADPVQVNSAEIRYVDIKSLLPERYRKQRDWGGFALTYYGTNREMWSQFRFLGVNGGQNIDEFFTVKEESRADRYEATWWMPDKSEAIVALGNISDAYTNATVIFGNGHTRMISLQPHATEFVREEQRDGGVQSVTVNVNGAAGSIVPTGLISAKDGSFNSVIRFYAPSAAKQSNLYANGFRVKGVTPHMALKNTTSNSLAVVPKFMPLDGTSGLTLPQVVLAANETREVDLSRLARASQRRTDLDIVSIEVTNAAAPGSVIGSLYSSDNETGTDYDTPLRDSGLVRAMTGSYPWKIEDDFSTIAYVTNISDQRAEFVGEINYQGGHVLLEPRKLNPHETVVFDLRDFRDNQKSDSTGNKLPADVSLGQFKWTVKGITNGKLLLVGRAEMVSRSERVSSSYSCNDPCPPYLQGDLNPFPPPIVFVSGTAPSSAWETAIYGSGYSYSWAASADWSADSSSMSVDPTAAHTTTLTGNLPGGVCVSADMGREESYGWDGLNCYDNNNSYPVGGSGCSDVADVRIYQDGSTDITDQTKNVIVGQQINLSVHVDGTTEAVSGIQWNVPTTREASYNASASSASVTDVNNWQASAVAFYWVDGADGREVHLGCRIGTQQFDKKATFNVKRPSAQVNVATNVSSTIDSATGQLELHLGAPPPSTPGLVFTRNLSLPQGFSGTTQWVQVFTQYAGGGITPGGAVFAFDSYGLDDIYPYSSSGATTDSPGFQLNSITFRSEYADYSATMWLMFKPSGVSGTSNWVPLRRVSWTWSAAANFSNGQWVMAYAYDPHGLADQDTTDYPTWTKRAQSP